MRTYLATVLLALPTLFTVPVAVATAQTAPSGVLTPAPVPNLGPTEVSPSDRAGRANGAERAAPFSGLPNTLEAGRGQPTPSTLGDPAREGAPAPSLSK